MRTQVKVIRFALIMSILLAIITYLVTLNMEIGFISLQTKWLSNNFALTVSGGAFASMLVVLICEIQKYLLSKKNSEALLFTHTACIYGHLQIMKTHLITCTENPAQPVPGELLVYSINNIRSDMSIVSNIDYFTFSHGKLVDEYQKLCGSIFQNVEKYLIGAANLNIAVLKDQVNDLKISGTTHTVTVQSYYTGQVVHILSSKIEPLINELDTFLCTLDNECKERFKWQCRRNALLANWRTSSYDGFNDFIRQGTN